MESRNQDNVLLRRKKRDQAVKFPRATWTAIFRLAKHGISLAP
jgi:hypothetical protein